MPQSNHFTDPALVERAFDASDGHFTPSFGKWMESPARLAYVKARLAEAVPAKQIDTDWAIECLSSNEDWELKGISKSGDQTAAWLRSFGRTPCKAYGQLMSIVRGDPDRGRRRDEVWMTLGERRPASHSTLLGWKIDWDALTASPIADRPARRTSTQTAAGRPNWEQALHHYVEACIAATRPKDANGAFLFRHPNREEEDGGYDRAIASLDRAIELALADGVEEIPFRYMRARLRHARCAYIAALDDWSILLEIWAVQKVRKPYSAVSRPSLMHPFEAALTLIQSAMTEDKVKGGPHWGGRSERLTEARKLLDELRQARFGKSNPAHPDLKAWEGRIIQMERYASRPVTLPEENFITVE
jgi:hypothetical protein